MRDVSNAHMRTHAQIDLKEIRLELTHYTLRNYISWDTEALRNWDLEGRQDGGAQGQAHT